VKKNYLKRFKNSISDIKDFGLSTAFSIFCTKIVPYAQHMDSKIAYKLNANKHRAILKYLKSKYGYTLNLLQESEKDNLDNVKDERLIWSFWWQGIDNAPELVKMCFSSIENNSNEHRLIVIDKYNFEQYVDLPEYIMEKLQSGNISYTHFSDIVRIYLLYKYGGVWIDSTMLLVKDIPEELFITDFFIGKMPREPFYCISEKRWNIAFLAGEPRNAYFYIMLQFYFAYWKSEDRVIDYFLMDYMTELIFNNIDQIKEMYERVPVNNLMMFSLDLNRKYNEDELNELTKNTFLFKNQRRSIFNNQDESENLTFFGFFHKKYMQSTQRIDKTNIFLKRY